MPVFAVKAEEGPTLSCLVWFSGTFLVVLPAFFFSAKAQSTAFEGLPLFLTYLFHHTLETSTAWTHRNYSADDRDSPQDLLIVWTAASSLWQSCQISAMQASKSTSLLKSSCSKRAVRRINLHFAHLLCCYNVEPGDFNSVFSLLNRFTLNIFLFAMM